MSPAHVARRTINSRATARNQAETSNQTSSAFIINATIFPSDAPHARATALASFAVSAHVQAIIGTNPASQFDNHELWLPTPTPALYLQFAYLSLSVVTWISLRVPRSISPPHRRHAFRVFGRCQTFPRNVDKPPCQAITCDSSTLIDRNKKELHSSVGHSLVI